MKKILFNFTLSFIAFIFPACNGDDSSDDQELVNSLLGEWEEISPCQSCSTVYFKNKNTIELKFTSDAEIYTITYTVNDNSILATRNWNVGNGKESNTVGVLFKTKDTLELLQFKVTDATSTTGFEDIILKRM